MRRAVRSPQTDRACDDARFEASLALDGALDEIGQIHLRGHLASCPECAELVAEMRAASALVRRAPSERLRRELAGGRLALTCSSGAGRYWAGAGVAVAAIVLAIGAVPRRGEAVAPSPRAAVVSPPALPIGQRSAMDDFAAPAVASARTS